MKSTFPITPTNQAQSGDILLNECKIDWLHVGVTKQLNMVCRSLKEWMLLLYHKPETNIFHIFDCCLTAVWAPYVTATTTSGWNSPNCGKCHEIVGLARTIYVTAIDQCENNDPKWVMTFSKVPIAKAHSMKMKYDMSFYKTPASSPKTNCWYSIPPSSRCLLWTHGWCWNNLWFWICHI